MSQRAVVVSLEFKLYFAAALS